ncbi:AraC family transcriptional regulator [Streptomyces sp. NPDC093094]|uniref:AraC family transcriptional regulator n=1 Tax=Streptomyces sp. NPDC093094 TaxID=3366026 RepID=UPI00381ECB5B
MLGTMFRSEDMPAEERFERWRELLDGTRSSEITRTDASEFRARCRLSELGAVTVLQVACTPTRYRRSERMVRRADPERYHLSLCLDGEMALDHTGSTGIFRGGDLHLVDSSHPYDLQLEAGPGSRLVTGVGVDFPKALLPLPAHRVHEAVGRGLSGREGLGALLAEFLVGLEHQSERLRPADAPRLGTVVLDLLSAWLAQVLETESALSPEAHGTVMAERVLAFIRQNLHDPELTPPVIADAHHISLSYLHRIFQQQMPGQTVSAWIRARRLEGARRDLADSSLRGVPIHAVAARWGLPAASGFTRVFRAAYGLSPREFRLGTPAERDGAREHPR